MSAPIKVNFKMYQGSTFNEVLRWETSTKVYKPITAISKTAPIVITAVGHVLPVGWRTKVTNVLGMKEINSADTYHVVTETTTDTVTINDINALDYTSYISGGVLEYNAPNSLVGVTARMQLRTKITDVLPIDEYTTENGNLIINDTNKTISILVSATDTALYSFSSVLYSMELIDGTTVTPFIYGSISLEKEVTR